MLYNMYVYIRIKVLYHRSAITFYQCQNKIVGNVFTIL